MSFERKNAEINNKIRSKEREMAKNDCEKAELKDYQNKTLNLGVGRIKK